MLGTTETADGQRYEWAERDEKHGKEKGNVATFGKNGGVLQCGEQWDTCIDGIRHRLTKGDQKCVKSNSSAEEEERLTSLPSPMPRIPEDGGCWVPIVLKSSRGELWYKLTLIEFQEAFVGTKSKQKYLRVTENTSHTSTWTWHHPTNFCFQEVL